MIKLKALHGALLCASPMCEETISRVLTVENCAQASPAKVGEERESWCPVFRASWIFHAAMAANHHHCPGHGPLRKVRGT